MTNCPNCDSKGLKEIYTVKNVPVNNVLLMETKEEAVTFPKRDIKLGFCEICGFVTNSIFDESAIEYSSKYEESQGFSPTFNAFHKDLALRLIEKYNLKNKHILEIGCGKGEFLILLCQLGGNTGIGFDPVYLSDRNTDFDTDKIKFVKEYYSEKYFEHTGDFVCCKMTLEHIPDTLRFIKMIRASLENDSDAIVYFLLPDAQKVFDELEFWDVFYEHCSYFSLTSLKYLFEAAGFEVLDIGREFDNQYLKIEAKPLAKGKEISISSVGAEMIHSIEQFTLNVHNYLAAWKDKIDSFVKGNKKVVLWGGGSKAVGFLTTLDLHDEIKYAVDINPNKHGTFLAGNGQEIVAPDFLKGYKPDLVIIMNPIYTTEIKKDLSSLGLNPEVLPIDFILTSKRKEIHE